MRRRIIMGLIAVVMLIPAQANAQGSRLHQLRTPSVDEYVSALSKLTYASPETQFLISDFERRFVNPDPKIPFARLTAIYALLKNNPAWTDQSLWENEQWESALISDWIEEHHINLDQIGQFAFALNQPGDYFTITVSPRDFNGDSGHEWLLTLSEFSDNRYMIASRDSAGNYHINPLLVPDFHDEQLIMVKDLIGTGVPQLVIVTHSYSTVIPDYRLFVFAWQNGQIVDLTASNTGEHLNDGVSFPAEATFDLRPSPNPKQYDILIHTPEIDNWGCQRTDTQVIRFNGTIWKDVQDNSAYMDVTGCSWRNAETDMWAGQWQRAIYEYQAGLIKMRTEAVQPAGELVQYIQFRLALAYLLNKQPYMSSLLSFFLHAKQPATHLIAQLYEALPRDPSADAYTVCVAAHDVFQQYINSAVQNYSGMDAPSPVDIVVGTDRDNSGQLALIGERELPDPAKAGCDISKLLLAKLQSQPFSLAETPYDQLVKRGFPPLRALNFDINHDGKTEWLIWLGVDSLPLFFAPNPDIETYHVSDIPFSERFLFFDGAVSALPSDNGYALAGITPSGRFNLKICPEGVLYGQTVGTYAPYGTFWLFQLQHSELVPILSSPICNRDLSALGLEFPYTYDTELGQDTKLTINPILPTEMDVYLPVNEKLSEYSDFFYGYKLVHHHTGF